MLISVATIYYHQHLQDLIMFLAIISTASWIAVLLTTLLRFLLQFNYYRRTKNLPEKEEA